jgi:hypothetical protein
VCCRGADADSKFEALIDELQAHGRMLQSESDAYLLPAGTRATFDDSLLRRGQVATQGGRMGMQAF